MKNSPEGKFLTAILIVVGFMLIYRHYKEKAFWMGVASVVLIGTTVIIKNGNNERTL